MQLQWDRLYISISIYCSLLQAAHIRTFFFANAANLSALSSSFTEIIFLLYF